MRVESAHHPDAELRPYPTARANRGIPKPKRKRPLTAQQRELERARKRRYYQAHREERLLHDREQYARIKKEYPRKYEERLAQIREYKRSKRLEQNK